MDEDVNFFEKYLHLLIATALGVGFWYFTSPQGHVDLGGGKSEKIDLSNPITTGTLSNFEIKRNPFVLRSNRPILINPTGAAQRRVELSGIVIDGVVCSPTQQSVIIGGKLYNVGEKYRDATIMKVAPDRVLFDYRGAVVEKRLNLPSLIMQGGENP